MATFNGTSGNDVLVGTNSNDVFFSSAGQDRLVGGAGHDRAVIDFSAITGPHAVGQWISYNSYDGIYGSFRGADGVTSVETVGIEELQLKTGALDDYVYIDLSQAPPIWKITIDAGAGSDMARLDLSYTSAVLVGNLASGTLTSNALTLVNFEQFDLKLGNGDDQLTLGSGNDYIEAGGGDDRIDGAGGHDTLEGGAGGDTLIGGDGNDSLFATDDYARTDSGSEHDVLSGGAGDDLLSVGYGDDADGGSGTDRLSLSLRAGTSGAVLDFTNLLAGGSIVVGGGTLTGFESYDTIYGTDYADTIRTGDAPNSGAFLMSGIFGFAGNDVITTGSRKDSVNGGEDDDVIHSGGDDDRASGDEGNDEVYGEAGNDLLWGGDGDDLVRGGDGHDQLLGGFGVDQLRGDTGNDTLDGEGGDDRLYGGAGSDTLSGGWGADRLEGGADNDVYIVDDFDTVIEAAGGGVDEIRTGASEYSLTELPELENLTGTYPGGSGFYHSQTLTGNSRDNRIDGGGGADWMQGGFGNDVYIVDDAGDTVVELAGQGTDEVQSSVSFILDAGIENLVLTGVGYIDGEGNDLANSITGNEFDNILSGHDGNDQLFGGGGTDVIYGGLGADILNGGADRDVFAYLARDESAGTSVDTIKGFVSGSDIIDLSFALAHSVSWTFANGVSTVNVETVDGAITIKVEGKVATTDFVLTPNLIWGTGGNDTLTGTADTNFLFGGAGADRMTGGEGDDYYFVDNINDQVVESAAGGYDVVESQISHVLGSEVEGLVLAGTAASNGTGNGGGNLLVGNDAANQLDGREGEDLLFGGGGADLLIGGSGDDELDGGDGWDVVSYAYAPTGVVVSLAISGMQNTAGAGSDTLTGIEELTGSQLADVLGGDALGNRLNGGEGDDVLEGGEGEDVLDGGAGRDSASYAQAASGVSVSLAASGMQATGSAGSDTLTGIENLAGSGFADRLSGNAAANSIAGGTGDDLITGGGGMDLLDGGEGSDVYLVGDAAEHAAGEIRDLGSEGADELRFTATIASTLTLFAGDTGVERIVIGTGTGTTAASSGTTANNVDARALGNAVTMVGNAGANTLTATAFDDLLQGGVGIDRLVGNGGNDTLDGGRDADKLLGSTGDDSYVVDHSSDAVIELAGEGTDTVLASVAVTLKANVESLVQTGIYSIHGSGNELANAMTGNAGSNKLYGLGGDDTLFGGAGNDYLDGGSGLDVLTGGLGNDSYVVDSLGDTASEAAGEGYDLIKASLSWTLGENFERLDLLGATAIDGTGNALGNVLNGNEGANALTGLAGNDKLYGRGGDDLVDGGDGVDWLEGGAGMDVMTGGAGGDRFVFRTGDLGSTVPGSCDVIRDYSYASGDRIRLDLTDANSNLAGTQDFAFIGTGAFTGVAGQLRYEQANGNTFVSADTDGDGDVDFMLQLDGVHTLKLGDFIL